MSNAYLCLVGLVLRTAYLSRAFPFIMKLKLLTNYGCITFGAFAGIGLRLAIVGAVIAVRVIYSKDQGNVEFSQSNQ